MALFDTLDCFLDVATVLQDVLKQLQVELCETNIRAVEFLEPHKLLLENLNAIVTVVAASFYCA